MIAAIAPSRPSRGLHQAAALADEADPSANERAGRDQREYWPMEWPAANRGWSARRRLRPRQRSRSAASSAIEVARSAGWALLGQVEGLGRSVPGQPAERFAERGVGSANTAAAAGEAAARAAPMPTDWDPWPGKTKAIGHPILRSYRRGAFRV